MNDYSSSGASVPYVAHNNTVSNMALGVPVAPQREIDGAMEALNREIEAMAKAVAELNKRLRAVLIPQPPQATETRNVATQYGCALAASIDVKTDYVRNNRERVEAMLASLQL